MRNFQIVALKAVPCGDSVTEVGQVLGNLQLEDRVPEVWLPRALCDHFAELVELKESTAGDE